MNKVLLGLGLLLAMIVAIPLSANADGGMFFPVSFPVYEKEQKALIYFHDGTEDLVIQPSYEGLAKDFVWVVPTPSKPAVAKSSSTIFANLQKLTLPDYRGQTSGSYESLTLDTADKGSVEIIEEQTIDSFDVITLKASSETALSTWMKENNYAFPEDKNYLLSDYINNGWYFVISNIRPEAEAGAQAELNNGTITPIRFTFKSDKIIYPMKLTKVAMEQDDFTGRQSDVHISQSSRNYRNLESHLTIYVLSKDKATNSEFNVAWANWLKPAELKKILAESAESSWIKAEKRMFLTKMTNYVYADRIGDDYIFPASGDNTPYPLPYHKEPGYWSGIFISFGISAVVLLLSPLMLLFVIVSLKEKYEEKWSRKGRRVKTALVGLPLLIVASILLKFWISERSLDFLLENSPMLGFVTAFMLLEIVLAVLLFKRSGAVAETNPVAIDY